MLDTPVLFATMRHMIYVIGNRRGFNLSRRLQESSRTEHPQNLLGAHTVAVAKRLVMWQRCAGCPKGVWFVCVRRRKLPFTLAYLLGLVGTLWATSFGLIWSYFESLELMHQGISDGLQPNSDGLQLLDPRIDGLQPRSDGLQPTSLCTKGLGLAKVRRLVVSLQIPLARGV